MTSYGAGPYGAGIYGPPGYVPPAVPVVPPLPWRATPGARHILGIGPWVDSIEWRGAANYGLRRGQRASVPIMTMPVAQSASLTMRLVGGSEARIDYEVPRDQAFVIDEMATDLWWRRRDGATGALDMLGRLNADNVDPSTAGGTNVRLSSTWVDYQGLLEDRLVMRYLAGPPTNESQWAAGTEVTEILRFAVPGNAGIDLSNIAVATAYNLGVTTKPFELPLGTPVSEVMTNLQAVSATAWEWWVEQPATVGARPKLEFTTGERGTDRGITLIDVGTGVSPIASWTMQAAGSRYANTLYYIGGTGGVVVDNPVEVGLYGARDATDTDSSLAGDVQRIELAAGKKLAELVDRRPTWTVQLQPGFWQGRNHIDLGDPITVRVMLGAELVTSTHRVTEITVEIDDSGAETVSLTVGPPRPARDPRSRNSVLSRLVRRLKNYERRETA